MTNLIFLTLSKNIKKDLDLRTYFPESVFPITNLVKATISMLTEGKVNKDLVSYSSNLLIKELRKLEAVNKEAYSVLTKKLLDVEQKFVNNQDWFILKADSLEESMKNFDRLYEMGTLAILNLSDTYILARILKSDNYKVNFIYVGNAHVKFIDDVLTSCGFELIGDNFVKDPKQSRCVPNGSNVHDDIEKYKQYDQYNVKCEYDNKTNETECTPSLSITREKSTPDCKNLTPSIEDFVLNYPKKQ